MNTKNKQNGSAVLWVIFLTIIIGVITAGIIYGQRQGSAGLETVNLDTEELQSILALTEDDNIKGDPSAPIIIIEYSDFQCPACQNFNNLTKDFLEKYDNQVALVFRHLPLRTIHPNADLAARVAEASGQQNKFFEMADLLFDRQSEWSRLANPRSTFNNYATELGLDLEKFNSDISSDESRDKVNLHFSQAQQILGRALATPTVFINGEAVAVSEVEATIASILESNNAPSTDESNEI